MKMIAKEAYELSDKELEQVSGGRFPKPKREFWITYQDLCSMGGGLHVHDNSVQTCRYCGAKITAAGHDTWAIYCWDCGTQYNFIDFGIEGDY